MKSEKLIKDIMEEQIEGIEDAKEIAYIDYEYFRGSIKSRMSIRTDYENTEKNYENIRQTLEHIMDDSCYYCLTEKQFENVIDNIINILSLKQVANKNMEKEMYDYEEY